MSNSYRNVDSRSEKKEKQSANRKLRRLFKQIDEDFIEPLKREISDRWNWTKDGMSWNKNKTSKEKVKRMENR